MGKAFENIKAGLKEAIAHAKGAKAGAGVRVYRSHVVDVQKLRLKRAQAAALLKIKP